MAGVVVVLNSGDASVSLIDTDGKGVERITEAGVVVAGASDMMMVTIGEQNGKKSVRFPVPERSRPPLGRIGLAAASSVVSSE